MGKLADQMQSYKRRLDGARLRTGTGRRAGRLLRTGTRRALEMKKLYDEFVRNKAVDL